MIRATHRAATSAIATVILLLAAACAHVTPPPQLSPIGDTAFYARRVIQAVGALQQAAIDGEAAQAISAADTRAIITATQKSAQAGSALADALAAGVGHENAKEQAIAIIKQALADLPGQLSDHGKQVAQPYIDLINTFLTVFA